MKGLVRLTRGISSIRFKFTTMVVSIGIFSFGIAAFLANQWTAEDYWRFYTEQAHLIQTEVLAALEEGMVFQTHKNMMHALNRYRGYEEVRELRIFDLRGQEVFGQKPGLPETRVGEALLTGEPIRFTQGKGDRRVTTYIIPLTNKPQCHSCHGSTEPLRGALLLSLPLEGLEKSVDQERQKLSVLLAVLAIVIGAAALVAVNRFFLRPLRLIQAGTQAIAKGEFGHQIPVASRDEIGSLAEHFNQMSQTLGALFQEIREKNEQLAQQVTLTSRAQREWKETFDCITDPIAVIDRECRIIKVNQAFRRTFKKHRPEAEDGTINRRCDELFGTCLMSNCINKSGARDKKSRTNEVQDPTTGRMFEITAFPYHSPGEDFGGSVFVAKDVTEKKAGEMRLIMSERLAALGEMASGIAHEINTPMATIALCTEGLLNRLKKGQFDPSVFDGYLRTIEEEVNRCRRITSNMLAVVSKRERARKDVDVLKALDGTLEMVNFLGRLKEVEILTQYQDEMPVLHLDESGLRQVLLAIVVNGLDAMQDRGRLTLEAGAEGEEVFIQITDTGPGIPPSQIERIFTPFFTTKSGKGGTGLGLSIARKIIDEANGRIEVTSREGKGTTFKIILPA